ncbi:MAG: fluoride efflux transporter CrcB [Deltaproteobacteria bacterium]|nr:fluoride efflux transporter CrcB [Deltaproteobacteria bacterium]
MKFLTLALAGAAGTLCRYFLGGWVYQWMGTQFPYGTLVVNSAGCFIIGFLGTLADERSLLGPELRLALLVGFLGAFTTFSSFTYETWNLFKAGETGFAALNVMGSFLACFIGLLLGILGARLI